MNGSVFMGAKVSRLRHIRNFICRFHLNFFQNHFRKHFFRLKMKPFREIDLFSWYKL